MQFGLHLILVSVLISSGCRTTDSRVSFENRSKNPYREIEKLDDSASVKLKVTGSITGKKSINLSKDALSEMKWKVRLIETYRGVLASQQSSDKSATLVVKLLDNFVTELHQGLVSKEVFAETLMYQTIFLKEYFKVRKKTFTKLDKQAFIADARLNLDLNAIVQKFIPVGSGGAQLRAQANALWANPSLLNDKQHPIRVSLDLMKSAVEKLSSVKKPFIVRPNKVKGYGS